MRLARSLLKVSSGDSRFVSSMEENPKFWSVLLDYVSAFDINDLEGVHYIKIEAHLRHG